MKHCLSIFLLMVAASALLLRPLFLIWNFTSFGEASLLRALEIMRAGLPQDLAMAGYASVLLIMVRLGLYPTRFRDKSVRIGAGFIAVVTALITTGDMMLYPFWQQRIDASVLPYLMNPSGVGESTSTGQVLAFIAITALLSAVLYLLLRPAARKIEKRTLNPRADWWKYALAALLLFGAIRGIERTPNSPVNAYRFKDKFSNHAGVNAPFSFFHSLVIAADETDVSYYEAATCKQIMEPLMPQLSDSTTLHLRTGRPNVVVIMLESYGAHLIEGLGGRPGVAPHLTSLCDSSICFTQAYCSSWRTMQGIAAMLSGYPAQPTTYILRHMQKARTLGGLPLTLHQAGYDTHVLYGGDITYFNFLDYFYACGHQSYTALADFPDTDQGSRSTVTDGETFNWLYREIQRRAGSGKPWYISFLTASSHEPFEVPWQALPDKRLNAFNYTDHCLGQFIERLRSTPAWQNLLIVVTADHSFIMTPEVDVTSPEYAHIPLMLTGGAIEGPARIDKIVSQTDIPATLLALLGLPHEGMPFSRNVLSPDYTYPWAYNSSNNAFMLRDSTGCTAYDMQADRISDHAGPDLSAAADSLRLRRAKAFVQTLYDDFRSR